MWLYSIKSGSFLAKWLYSGKVVVFGQDGSIGQNGCVRTKVVVFRKMVLFGQKWLYSGKSCSST